MAITNWLKPEELKDFIVSGGGWIENTSGANLDFWIIEKTYSTNSEMVNYINIPKKTKDFDDSDNIWIRRSLVNFASHTGTPKEMLFVSIPAVGNRIAAKARQWARLDDSAIICAAAFAIHDAFS